MVYKRETERQRQRGERQKGEYLVLGATQRDNATTSAHAQIWTLLKWEQPSHTYLTNRLPGKCLFSTSVFALWRKSEEEGDCSDS